MTDDQKRIIKTGKDFKQFPAMKVAKIYASEPEPADSNPEKNNSSKSHPIYKKQVEIARPIINTSWNTVIPLQDETVKEFLEMEWTIVLHNHQFDQTSDRLLVSGLLLGDLTYISRNEQQLRSHKVTLPWKSHTNITYTYLPVDPIPNHVEIHYFKSTTDDITNVHTHYIYGKNETTCELIMAQITSTEEIRTVEKQSELSLLIDASIHVRLLQTQIN